MTPAFTPHADATEADFLAALHARVEAGYPRPRLVRDRWVDLCGAWEFAFDDGDVGIDEEWAAGPLAGAREIEVPYPFEAQRSGIGDAGRHPVAWYRRQVVLPERGAGERHVLHFGAVDYAASVFVDGRLLGQHAGGHTPFSVPLPAALSGEVAVVVRCEDQPERAEQPRGKQDWRAEPHSIWYGRTSGIWQPVWLEVVPATHLVACDFVSDVAAGRIESTIRLNRGATGALRLRFSLDGVVVAEQTQQVAAETVTAAVALPVLANAWEWEHLEWSPEHPRLLGVEVTLLDAGGAVIDRALTYAGLRSVSARAGQFLLNRRPYFLRLVLAQGYWPDTRLAAPARAALHDEVALIASLGFNGVRVHQKIEDPLFLYWCDRLGLLVWEEMPSCGTFSPAAARRSVAEWAEAIERDRGHPCVVVWVPFNESWGIPAVATDPAQAQLAAGVAALTRALDASRLVVSNDGWEHVASDLMTVHDYSAEPDTLIERYGTPAACRETLTGRWPSVRALSLAPPDDQLPVVLSEFGGVALSRVDDGDWHGYSDVSDPADLAKSLEKLFGALHRCAGLAGFCYTQLSDTEQETNGLTWADRTPKLPAAEIAAFVTGRGTPAP